MSENDSFGLPRYLQLVAFLRRNIEIGVWPLGTKIPSLEELALSFSISRLTARQAVQRLVSEKILETRQGKGTFVIAQPQHQAKNKVQLKTSWNELVKRIEGYTVEILSESESKICPTLIGKNFKLYPQYHFMKRLHSFEGKPCVLLEVYVATEVFNLAPEKIRKMPVLSALDPLIEVSQAKQVLTIGIAGSEAAHFLQIESLSPVANVMRTAQDKKGKLFYSANLIFPGEQVYQEIDLI